MLIIGGSFSGLAAGRDLGTHYLVTIIDAKDDGSLDIPMDFLWIPGACGSKICGTTAMKLQKWDVERS